MESEKDIILSSGDSYAEYVSTSVADEIVERLHKALETQWEQQLQVANANMMDRLETMFQEFSSKQDVAFERLVYVVQGHGDAETIHSEEMGRSKTLPDEVFCGKTDSQKKHYSTLLRHARCSSQRATAARLRLLHTDQLLPKPAQSPTESTMLSCPAAMMLRPRLDQAASPSEMPSLRESKKQHEKAAELDTGLTEQTDPEVESTNEQNRGKGGNRVASHVLPCSVQDDANFFNVLSSSSTSVEVHGSQADREASPVARDSREAIYSEDEQSVDDMVQIHKKRTVEFLRLVWASCGIVPWSSSLSSKLYRQVIILITGCSMLHSMYELVYGPSGMFENLAKFSLSICVFLNLIFLRNMGSLVGPFGDQFTEYATEHNFLDEWAIGGMWRLLFIAITWATTSSLICVPLAMKTANWYTIILWSMRDGLMLAILHCLWQVLVFLELMVDTYCIEFFERLNCQLGVARWNRLQALLHYVAETVENSFLAVQSAMMVALLCCTAQLVLMSTEQRSSMISIFLDELHAVITPLVLLGIVAAILFSKAASVTEKCLKAAPLVNSVTLADNQQHMNHELQYLVTYIIQSNAGFYVKGSRFTKAMLVKSCYFIGTVICGLGTTILTIRQKG